MPKITNKCAVSVHFSAAIAILALFVAIPTYASETYVLKAVNEEPGSSFTMENWFTRAHPHVSAFTTLANGNSFGTTTTGSAFRQYTVPNDAGVHVQRFEIDTHYHYIVEGRIVNTLETLSAQLALAFSALQQ